MANQKSLEAKYKEIRIQDDIKICFNHIKERLKNLRKEVLRISDELNYLKNNITEDFERINRGVSIKDINKGHNRNENI